MCLALHVPPSQRATVRPPPPPSCTQISAADGVSKVHRNAEGELVPQITRWLTQSRTAGLNPAGAATPVARASRFQMGKLGFRCCLQGAEEAPAPLPAGIFVP